MNRAEILSVANLLIQRGATTILQNVNWTVRRGEQWVILGANGSGKTSLLKALTGYLTPTDGVVNLLGREFGEADWRELRERIGVVSASVSGLMHEEDSAWEIVVGGVKAMIGVWGKFAEADWKKASRLLSSLGVGYLRERPWQVLSQGERQRVLIARAMMAAPAVLILDEPCAGLDPVAREYFLQDMEKLAGRKSAPALVLVTHHIEEITPSFTHVLGLLQGEVAFQGERESMLSEKNLSLLFGAKARMQRNGERFNLSFTVEGHRLTR
jgi:iron complex transport system ATP-binding protein